MLKLTIKEAQKVFFDRQAVIDRVGKANAAVANRQGAYVRTIMSRSMKVKKGPSAPGSPPNAHERKIKDFVFYGYDEKTGTVIVGPVKLGKGTAPEALENGGTLMLPGVRDRNGVFIPLAKMNASGRIAAIRSGKVTKMAVPIKPRPFAKPALEKAKPKLASFWKDQVRK